MSEELKKCPICGGKPRYIKTESDGEYIVCSDCLLGTKVMFPEKGDVSAILRQEWNHRPLEAALQTELAVFQSQLIEKDKEIERLTHLRDGLLASTQTDAKAKDSTIAELWAELTELKKRFATEIQQDAIDRLNKTGRYQPYGKEAK